jgi:hypothetical protein
MHFIRNMALAATMAVLAACGGGTNEAADHDEHAGHDHAGHSHNSAAGNKSEVELLREDMIAFHDEAMPKMGKLKGYINTAKLAIDSLSKKTDGASKKLKVDYENLLSELEAAQKGMNDWMDNIDIEPQNISQDSIIKYFEVEKAKAKTMRDNIFKALDQARLVTGEK